LDVAEEFGNAPVVVAFAAGTQGLIGPVLSVVPVPIAALLAPEPAFPASELVSAIVVEEDGF
jgi:hypothetical protein